MRRHTFPRSADVKQKSRIKESDFLFGYGYIGGRVMVTQVPLSGVLSKCR